MNPIQSTNYNSESYVKRKRDEYQSELSDPKDDVRNRKKRSITNITKKIKTFDFIRDDYTEARGEPKMLEIACRTCNQWIIDYQKDGPGRLLRCYTDRIYHPKRMREIEFHDDSVKNEPSLTCTKCNTELALPMIYRRTYPKQEIRSAYLIIKDNNVPRVIFRERIK